MIEEGRSTDTSLRDAVRQLCAKYPNAYWRDLDERREYPDAFVRDLTEAGYLAALIPEEFGGIGLSLSDACIILEEINHSGGNAAACHAQMYTMGTLLRHGNPEQKARYLPEIASGAARLQAFAVTEPTTGSDTTKLKTKAVREGSRYVISGQKVWISRALQSDLMILLARTTPIDEVKRRGDGLSVFIVDMREALGNGMTVRPIATMMNHSTTEIFFDNLSIPAENLIGEEGSGFRYILDGMNAERILIAAECVGDGQTRDLLCQRTRGLRARDRAKSRYRVSASARACEHRGRRPHAQARDRVVRIGTARRRRSEHGEDARGRCFMGGRERVYANVRRLWFRNRI
jgi:acyl-CoA dehydrogenase